MSFAGQKLSHGNQPRPPVPSSTPAPCRAPCCARCRPGRRGASSGPRTRRARLLWQDATARVSGRAIAPDGLFAFWPVEEDTVQNTINELDIVEEMLSNGHFVESWDKDEKDIADAYQAQKSETTDNATDDVVIGITKNRFPGGKKMTRQEFHRTIVL